MKDMLLIAAGGTIDAEKYDYANEKILSFHLSAIRDILESVRPDCFFRVLVPFHKDSDEMTDDDREKIVRYCTRETHLRILITHGTGTMIKTGLVLAEEEALKKKTIVLTGSLPYADNPTCAAFNIGSAITACQILSPGVYIVTGGETVSVKKAEKRHFLGITFFSERK